MSSASLFGSAGRFLWPWALKAEAAGPAVSIVELNGVLRRPSSQQERIQSSIFFENARKTIDKAFDVPKVQAVALDINCPGGSPAQCELIASYIRGKANKSKVPVLAFANDVAASGGYWLMCAADELFACKTSLVGSIGVVGNSFGFVDVLRRLGVERRIAAAGENKVQADPFSELTDEQRAQQEELMTSLHDSFITFVKSRRGDALSDALSDPSKSQLFTGKVWTGTDAVKLGLIDRVGTLDEVIREKYGDEVSMHRFGKPKSPWWAGMGYSSMAGLAGIGSSSATVSTLLEELLDTIQTRGLWSRYQL